ncbi:hypothetical protein BGW42_001706 [Actinomortierella wolfii]|nr:hypothetical protein BGW42_001706 [Actinomortierella wolfii]
MAPILPIATKAAKNKDVSYHLLYFGLLGRGELTRTILVYTGAKWDELEVDWATQKSKTRFGVIPVLYEEHADGTVLELAESQAIERYLARKYDLLGSNEWEEHLVNEYFNNTDQANIALGARFISAAPETRVEAFNKLIDEFITPWIVNHEKHLAANGGNGHYVGDKTTLADLKTHLQINRFLLYKPKEAKDIGISKEKTPNLWKLKETIESNANYAAWYNSERYRELEEGTRLRLKL